MSEPLRILLWGDVAATGFGTVTTDLGKAMLARGISVRFVSLNEDRTDLPEPIGSRTVMLGNPNGWLGMTEFDREHEAMGFLARLRGLFTGGIADWIPDATVIIGDPASIIRSGIVGLIPDGFPAWHYVPIEGTMVPPAWASLWERMRPVAMSEFGAAQVESITGQRPPFVYHGVDTESFYPVSRERPIIVPDQKEWLTSKDDCKRLLGYPVERTMLFRADRNMPRKRYGSLLRVCAPVMAKHPEVDLVMHCKTIDEGGNLDDFRSHFQPELAARMVETPFSKTKQAAPRWYLNVLYNAADVYVSTAAEGFGLTIAEALACGTPAVGMDFSSVPEVIGNAGTVVPLGGYIENIYAYLWGAIDEPKATEAVEYLVTHKRRRRELGRHGPSRVARLFTWAQAAQQFESLIAERPRLEVVA